MKYKPFVDFKWTIPDGFVGLGLVIDWSDNWYNGGGFELALIFLVVYFGIKK